MLFQPRQLPYFNATFYANPVALIATSPKVLQRLLDEVYRISTAIPFDICSKKAKVLAATGRRH